MTRILIPSFLFEILRERDYRVKKYKLSEIFELPVSGEWGKEIGKEEHENIVKVIRTTNFTNIGKLDYNDIVLRNVEKSKVDKKKLIYGDIILEKSGGTNINPVGRVVYFDKKDMENDYITNNFTSILRVKEKNINSKYLLYYLLFNYKCGGISKYYNKTTGIQNLQVSKFLENTYFNIPSIETQNEVVNIIEKIQKIIQKKIKQLKKSEELKKSLFYEMFGDPIRNEKGWEVKKLSEVSDIKSGGTPSTKNKEYWENGDISWIGSNMCQNKVIYENNGKFITQKGLENSSAKVFEKDVILIALVGATIGKVALLKFLTTTNQNIAGIKILDNKRYKSEYIFYILQFLYPKFQKLGGDKFKMANLSFIKNLTILDVSYTLQNKFAKKVEKIDKLKFEIEQSLKETENLYNSLMQKFF